NSACPILLGFPLYRWRIRVLTLDPMPRAAGDIGEAEPLLISCFRGPPLVSVIDPSVNLILYPLPQFRNGSMAPAIAARYARRSTLFSIFPDMAPSSPKRTPPGRPPAKPPTDQTSHKARMRFP